MKLLPTWCYRDVETSIGWLLTAASDLGVIENDPNISRQTRELTSDARTSIKAALMLLREVRSQHENLLSDNGQETEERARQDR